MRPIHLRRSWLFVGAADKEAILSSNNSDADVCIQEFEDFCVPELRREARLMMPDVLSDWRARQIVATVRINPLEDPDGLKDLDAAMHAGADAILVPKANTKEQILLLQKHINDLEKQYGRIVGGTAIIPNIAGFDGKARRILTRHRYLCFAHTNTAHRRDFPRLRGQILGWCAEA